MNYEILKKENGEMTVKITVPNEAFKKAVTAAYNKNKGKFSVPGFRKGKVPKNIIEKHYGEGVFYEDAINDLLPEYYEKVLDELKIEPVARPDIDIMEIDKDKDLVFAAVITTTPEFELEGYKGLEVEKVSTEVTDEMVEHTLKEAQEMNARLVNVIDRPVADGDTVLIDYKGFVGDEQFEGGTADHQELVIGSGKFIPGFEEQLIGASIGSEVEVDVTFPETYHSEDLAGKAAKFYVKINGIKIKELPEIDDEFAKDVSEFDTLDEYKASIREDLEASLKETAESEQREKVIEKAIELIKVDIPEKMVEAEVDAMLNDFDQQLRYQGLSLDQYVKFTGGDLDALKSQMHEDAVKRVKSNLVIEKLIKIENIEVTDEDVDAEIEKIATSQDRPVEDIKKIFERDNFEYLKNSLQSQKAINFLVEHAKF
ncbi:MAG: trigger factor [Clostridiales bacterium]|nr:trigger factor [Clostridiales bacterium]